MTTYLDSILEAVRSRLPAEKKTRSRSSLDHQAGGLAPPRDFVGAVRNGGISLVAEIKRRSPSAGPIRPDLEPAQIARIYERAGASAVSVLTEAEFFGGSLEDLARAGAACSLPVLRKDFLIDPYQVVQARVGGADAVLLIVAALQDAGLYTEMVQTCAGYGLPAVVEVHDEWELEAAFAVPPGLIGVNQRNLRTFDIDQSVALRLRKEIPRGVPMIAESGIKSREQVVDLEQAGVDAILVGETLMRAQDPGAAAAGLLGRAPEDQAADSAGMAT